MLSEVQAMQNPALGAALIWSFASGCDAGDNDPDRHIPSFVLSFIVLPIVLHSYTFLAVSQTKPGSGLRKFEEKFEGRVDVLAMIQPRAISMRSLTLRSISIALSTKLIRLDVQECAIRSLRKTRPPGQSPSVVKLMGAAQKLGMWFRDLTLFEIGGILKVRF